MFVSYDGFNTLSLIYENVKGSRDRSHASPHWRQCITCTP